MEDARHLYDGLLGNVAAELSKMPHAPSRRFVIMGIFWPSKKWQAVPKAVGETVDSLILTRNMIVSSVAARVAPQLMGPIGIAQATGEVTKQAG